jgi:hypothetical protein
MSDSEDNLCEAVPQNIKKRRGRPRKEGSAIVRPDKVATAACTEQVVLQSYADERNRTGREWVEVAPRPVGRELTAEEQLSFLRCVASIRRMVHTSSLAVRCSGRFEVPQPVCLAAQLMGISEVVGKRIHAQFQDSKVLPEGSRRGVYSRSFAIDELFGQQYLESWTRIVVQQCIAERRRV